jgi:hypothetical protein
MKTFDDIQMEGRMRVLLWGPPGSGKTALAGTFPGVVFLDLDDGLKVLKSKWFLTEWHKKRPDLVGYDTFDNTYDAYGVYTSTQGFWDGIKFINSLVKNQEVKTLVIDSLTVLQSLAMHVGIDAAGGAKRSQTKNQAKNTHTLLPTQADFGAEMGVIEQFMHQLIKLPFNIVCTAHEREVTTQTGAVVKREPYLIGSSIRALVAKWFDEVWYLDVDAKGVRKLLTDQTNILKSNKSRLGVPNGLEDPSYTKILASIKK